MYGHAGRLWAVAAALVAAAVAAVALLAATPAADGQTTPGGPGLSVDEAPGGAAHARGELLLALEVDGVGERVEAAVRQAGGEVEEPLPAVDAVRISLPEARSKASEEARVRALERARSGLERSPLVESADYNYVRSTSFTPNDRFFDRQEHLSTPAYEKAWNVARGNNGVKIAVVDSGIAHHGDLRDKIAAERDFVDDDGRAQDNVGHGTHVAGVAGALSNNEVGVAGACHRCELLVARSFGPSGGTDADIARGINWSSNNGADVINMSFGGPERSGTLERAVNRSYDRGAVLVAAAGNGDSTQKNYPAAYGRVMAVAATNRDDKRASFSQRGNWISVAAPGVDVFSTTPGGYDTLTGTSQASPNVAGLAGLLAAEGKGNIGIRKTIQRSATDKGPEGRDFYYGHGRINANGAVRR